MTEQSSVSQISANAEHRIEGHPPAKPLRNPLQPALIYGLAGLYFLLIVYWIITIWGKWAYDDPFITYRYTSNLLRGIGFVYNPGERVLSTTAPFFALLLAALSPLSDNLPRMANLIGALSIAAGGLLFFDIARSLKSPIVGWVGLLLYPSFTLLLNTIGSETPLYITFALASFAFYFRQNLVLTAAFCALTVITRPDGVLVPMIISLDYLARTWGIRRQRQTIPPQPDENGLDDLSLASPVGSRFSGNPRLAFFLFIALTIPLYLFAWVYFGSPIPATLAAKQYQGLMDISREFPAGLYWTFKYHLNSWYHWVQLGLATIGIFYLFFSLISDAQEIFLRQRGKIIRRKNIIHAKAWMVFMAWPLSYSVAYSILGLTSYFWYYAPLIPGLVVLVGLGVSGIDRFVRNGITALFRFAGSKGRRFASTANNQTIGETTLPSAPDIIASLSVATIIIALGLSQGLNIVGASGAANPRSMIYRKAGLWLNKNTPANAKVGTLEVGIIGYYSNRPIVDFAGLIQPDIAKYLNHGTTYEDSALYSIEKFQPDYLVLIEGSFRELEQGYVADHCTIAALIQGYRYNYGANLIIYQCERQDLP